MSTPIILFNFKNYWMNPFIGKFINPNFEGILIFEENKKPIFISHPFNFEQAKKKYPEIIVKNYSNQKELEKLLNLFFKKKVGYDSKHTTINQMKTLKKILKKRTFIDCSKIIAKNREIKNVDEIKNISIASRETKKVVKKAKQKLVKGITEKEIDFFIRNEFQKDNFETAFCIIAFGKNTKNLHHIPTNKKLFDGPVLFDVGAKYNNYCADFSTSFWFGEKTKKYIKFEKDLKKVNDCLKRIESKLNSGRKASELFAEANNLRIPHAIGHGIGLEEHDFPEGISLNSNWRLKEGMVLAIEPAIYNNFGIRIEKNYLIKKDGFKEL